MKNNRQRKINKKLDLNIILKVIVFLLALQLTWHFVFYKYLIFPKLNDYKSMPLVWWGLPIFIYLFICSYFGSKIKDKINFVIIVFLSSFLFQLNQYILAIIGEPGHLKSYAIEDPVRFWTSNFLIIIFIHINFFLFGVATKLLVNKFQDNKT